MPKVTHRGRTTTSTNRHAPLGQQYANDENRSKYATVRSRSRSRPRNTDHNRRDGDEGGGEDTTLLDEKTSRKILELGKEQMLEVEREEEMEERRMRRVGKGRKDGGDGGDSSESEEEEEEDDGEMDQEELVQHGDGYVTVAPNAQGLSAEEEAVVAAMMGENTQQRRTLADIILEKIAEKEAQQNNTSPTPDQNDDDEDYTELPPKVVEVYTEIGNILSRYTAGKLPKAFKVIPSLSNWESVLYLTRPDRWTSQAMYAATRIFASNLNPKMAQRFYSLVLLDAVRADICENHKLNYHYYISLKKAVYKPAAFFKGILLPLCRDGCTLREAAIVASVLQRVSVPVHHAAVALHKLGQMEEYNGAASIFIKTLLNKKYALPAPVIGSLVEHFARFASDEKEELPVLWHQALLVFVQRYKNEVGSVKGAKEKLRVVMKVHSHYKLTPEIRRELFGSQAWKEEREASCLAAGVAMET